MATFVLVHGAWHGRWCWSRVVPLLEAAGHRAFAPSLTGAGERVALLTKDVGLEVYVRDIVELIEEQRLRDVILVGHSYAGLVITGVADRVPDKVGHLVYFDTFVPKDGESMATVVGFLIGIFRRQARRHGDGWRIDPPARNSFGVTDAADVKWLRSLLTPQPLKSFDEPLRLKDPKIVARFPRTHFRCTRRGALVGLLGSLSPRSRPAEPGWRLRELPTGHDAMITMPGDTAALLLECAT
jgi:pimeloyl-ACP methyl ester carboxylesterase